MASPCYVLALAGWRHDAAMTLQGYGRGAEAPSKHRARGGYRLAWQRRLAAPNGLLGASCVLPLVRQRHGAGLLVTLHRRRVQYMPKHTNDNSALLSFEECCRAVLAAKQRGEGGSMMAYAASYAQTGLNDAAMSAYGAKHEGQRVQALYIRSNLSAWRGDEAKRVKASLDAIGKAKR
jgi:hypothetical protein